MRRWIHRNFERWWIDRDPPDDGWQAVELSYPTVTEALRLLRLMGFDERSGAGRRHELELLATDTGSRAAFPREGEEALVAAAKLIARRRLRVWRDRIEAGGIEGELDKPWVAPPMEQKVVVKGASGPPPPPPPPPPKDQTHWIEISLHDKDGKPMPGFAYEIVLPGGEVVTGALDDKGKARLDGIEAGNCQVSFPTLHMTEWRPAA